MKILIGCEESQIVTEQFRKLGFEAYSCDIQKSSGNLPEYHFQNDIFNIINSYHWDVLICFPPCTHLAVSCAAYFEQKRKDGRQKEAINFFLQLVNVNIKHIAIENPVGIMSNIYKKPDQIINPYYFGDPVSKKTCLWLKNLPKLIHVKQDNLFDKKTWVNYNYVVYNDGKKYSGGAAKWYKTKEERSKERSKTFFGIANAMAIQWGNYLKSI